MCFSTTDNLAVTCSWTLAVQWNPPVCVSCPGSLHAAVAAAPAPVFVSCRALGVAAISCKLTVLSVLFAVTSAAFGASIDALTLQNAVRLLLLRGGLAVGLLWKLRLLLWQQLTVGAAKKVKRDRFVASVEQLQ